MKTSERRWSAGRLRSHWDARARAFRPFTNSPTTQYYFRDEQRLFRTHFGELAGKRLLKLDLWNDLHNTRILAWAARQGAATHALDISEFVVRGAARTFAEEGLSSRFVLADCRQIPFADRSFDHVYTMGTIEHFDGWEHALSEIRRVLVPGGTAVIGVPNRFDPFLRPAIVAVLSWFGLYPYAPERSFGMGALARAIRAAGLEVEARDGILFYPALLRMADVYLHQKVPLACRLFVPTVWPFETLARRFESFRRRGYLICCRARRPLEDSR